MSTETTLEGQVAIVTGGTSGIGRETVKNLAGQGCSIVIADIYEEPRPSSGYEGPTADVVPDDDDEVVFVKCDVTSEEQVTALFEETLDEFGGLNILVNCAGTGTISKAAEMELENWNQTLNVNLTGTFLTSKLALIAFRDNDESEKSTIVNISSSWGKVPGEGFPAYCASKAGVELFSKQLALDYSADGIRVNTVLPGATETPLAKPLLEIKSKEAFIEEIPMGRLGQPEEVAEAISFLVSDKASYITGESLEVNGGWTL
jgi:NAD(P)-dependent dehydrogenase (short-subunit alcohol dehydrogenase family)